MKSQSLKYLPVNVANILISFGTITILTRLLSAAEFGRYALVITTFNFVHMGLFTWLEASMARFRERAEMNGEIPSHYKTLYGAALGLLTILVPILLVLIYTLPLEERLRLLLTFTVVISAIHLIYNLTLEGHKAAHRISRYSAVHSTQLVLSFAIGIMLVMLTPLREAGPFVGMLIGGAIAVLAELPFVAMRMRAGKFDRSLLKEYFIFGTPICFSLVLAYALENGDLFFIKYFMNDQSVGAYSAGYNLASRSFDFIFVWLSMAAVPLAVSAFEREGKDKAKQVLADYCDTLIIVTLPAAVGIALVSKEAVFVLGEPVRQEALTIMPYIAFAALLNGFINYYVHQAFVLAKKLNVLAGLMIIPVLINFALNIIFIPKLGLQGAVIATLCAYSIAIIITIIVARNIFALPLQGVTFLKCGLACLVMAVCLINLPVNVDWPDFVVLFIKSAIGAIIYGLCIYGLDTANVRHLIKNAKR